MVVAVLPNLDKPGCSDVVEKLGMILKNEDYNKKHTENMNKEGKRRNS